MDARGGILSESLVCGIGDEDAWFYKVIHPTLRLALEGRNLLQVDIVKSHPINSEMLPITRKNDRIRGKADYAFSFHRGNVHASELYDRFHLAGLGYRISHVTDAYTGQVALFSGIEVREENGGKNEALVQLAVWLSAGLENVRRLGEMGHKRKYLGEELRPMVGWTIIGHDWHTCIASRADKNGRDVCNIVGPWSPAAANSRDVFGLFKILRLIKRVEKFASQEYWPWLKDEILEPCASGDN